MSHESTEEQDNISPASAMRMDGTFDGGWVHAPDAMTAPHLMSCISRTALGGQRRVPSSAATLRARVPDVYLKARGPHDCLKTKERREQEGRDALAKAALTGVLSPVHPSRASDLPNGGPQGRSEGSLGEMEATDCSRR